MQRHEIVGPHIGDIPMPSHCIIIGHWPRPAARVQAKSGSGTSVARFKTKARAKLRRIISR